MAWQDNGRLALRLAAQECPCLGQPQHMAELWDFLVLGAQWLREGCPARWDRTNWSLVQGVAPGFFPRLHDVYHGWEHPLSLEDDGGFLGAFIVRNWGGLPACVPDPQWSRVPVEPAELGSGHLQTHALALEAVAWAGDGLRRRFPWRCGLWDIPRSIAYLAQTRLPNPWRRAFATIFLRQRENLPLLACDSSHPLAALLAQAALENPMCLTLFPQREG